MFPALRREPRALEEPEWFRREISRLFSGWPSDATDFTAGSYPVDVREDEDKIYVDAEMPGFHKEDINVTLQNGTLCLSAERKPEEFKGTQHLQERRYMRVQRSFTLPTGVDEGKVHAKFEDGVLHLELAKSPTSKPQKIDIL